MAEWREEQLGSLVSFEYGSALRAASRTGSGFNVYGSNGVVGHHDTALVSGPGIVIGRKGSVGAVHWSEDDFWPIDTTYWVKPTADLNLRWMRDTLGLAGLESLDSSTGVPGLNRYDAYERRVPVPPVEEQRRIAEILDTIAETIRATERVIAKHTVVRAGIVSDLLEEKLGSESPASRQPSGTLPLRDCGRWLSGGTPDTGNLSYWGGEIPWITASSLKSRYLTTSIRRLTQAGVKAGSRIVPPGTVIFVVRGMSLKKEFRVGMALRPVAFGQDCKALVPADGIDPKYLLFAMEAAQNRVLRLVDEASHGTGRLATPLLGELKLRLPPLEEQRRIAGVVEMADEAVEANVEECNKLRQLQSGLAGDLLSGRVRTVAR